MVKRVKVVGSEGVDERQVRERKARQLELAEGTTSLERETLLGWTGQGKTDGPRKPNSYRLSRVRKGGE